MRYLLIGRDIYYYLNLLKYEDFNLSAFIYFSSLFAQVKGTVADESGEGIIGANVVVKGTNVGTITD
jgi:hypothetical protein